MRRTTDIATRGLRRENHLHHLGFAESALPALLRQRVRHHPQHRPAGAARHGVRQPLRRLPALHAGAPRDAHRAGQLPGDAVEPGAAVGRVPAHHAARAMRRVQPHDHRPLPLLPRRRRGLQHHLQLVGVPARPGGRHLAAAGRGAAQAGGRARPGGAVPLGLLAQSDLGAHGARRGLFDAALLRARPGIHRPQPRGAGLALAPGGVRPARAVRLSGPLPRALRRPLGRLPLYLAAVRPPRPRVGRRGDRAPHPRLLRRRTDHGRPLARQAARQAGPAQHVGRHRGGADHRPRPHPRRARLLGQDADGAVRRAGAHPADRVRAGQPPAGGACGAR